MSAGRKNNAGKKDWCTPPKYVDAVLKVWRTIALDPCSNQWSLVPAQTKYELPVDGLQESWDFTTIYVNPPYGRDYERKTSISDWIKMGANAFHQYKSEVMMLIPVATNTRHFKECVFVDYHAICFLADTRLRFYNYGKEDKKGAPMACCMIYAGYQADIFEGVFSEYGKTFRME